MSGFKLDRDLFVASRPNGARAYIPRRVRPRLFLSALGIVTPLLIPLLVLAIRFDVPQGIQAQVLGQWERARAAARTLGEPASAKQAAAASASNIAIRFHDLLCPLFNDCGEKPPAPARALPAAAVPPTVLLVDRTSCGTCVPLYFEYGHKR